MEFTTSETNTSLIEPLTRRELEILGLLAQKLTDREIAKQLTLGLSTVKWHTRQVYAKLGVNRRSEVLARARELGLLHSSHSPIPKHNLPVQLTSFIGREEEIPRLCRQLKKKNTRLFTLTGSGGTGKTRLALRLAGELLGTYPDGVWVVELAALADPLLVPQTVIAALGLVEQPGKSLIAQLVDLLHEKQLLIILDNCEHLVAACAQLASTLLHSAPRLTILATSREILGVAGEQAYRVPPLAMPDPDHLPSLEELSRYEAVRLFLERAQMVDPDFVLTQDNAAAVAQITRRLDGIPLALELAAARLRVLSVNQIAERLDDAFRLLTGGSRTALPRHQTLTALIDWSYDLLTAAERGLLRLLSVFAGGWTLDAAEQVCAESGSALDLLGQLADKSLILATPTPDGGMRYRMLETVRQYTHARLVEAGEMETKRRLHLDYFLNLAESLATKLRGREQIAALDALGRDLDNLRLALEWGLKADIEAELRLASALQWFWFIRHHWGMEGINWLEQGLAVEKRSRDGQPVEISRLVTRASALTTLGYLLMIQRNQPATDHAMVFLEEALLFYRDKGPDYRADLGWALVWLGQCKSFVGDAVQAGQLGEEALGLFRETNDRFGTAEAQQLLGNCALDPARKKECYQEKLTICAADGDIHGMATAFFHIADTYAIDGDYARTYAEYKTSQDYYLQAGDRTIAANSEMFVAIASFLSGDLEGASLGLEKALIDFREMGHDFRISTALFWKGCLALAQGSYDQAAGLNEEAWQIADRLGDSRELVWIDYQRARLARMRGDIDAARRYTEMSLAAGRSFGYPTMVMLLEQGQLDILDGNWARARTHFVEGLHGFTRLIDLAARGSLVDALAILTVQEGQLERAARLFGTRLWHGFSNILSPIERAEREAVFVHIRAALGEERFEELREEGRALGFMQVLALAQEE